jgi:very-short-patch-repair endonuclease
MNSTLEQTFVHYLSFLAPDLKAGMVEQYRIAPGRRYRLDAAWPDKKIGVELEGGLYSGGAHSRPVGIQRDIHKHNFAVMNGWRVLRFSTRDIEDDPEICIAQIRALIEAE